MPASEPQFEVRGLDRALVGRADFAWPELRTLGEFDDRVKYGREDALRDLGWEIVRWVWSDPKDPRELLDRLERAFARGAGRRP